MSESHHASAANSCPGATDQCSIRLTLQRLQVHVWEDATRILSGRFTYVDWVLDPVCTGVGQEA